MLSASERGQGLRIARSSGTCSSFRGEIDIATQAPKNLLCNLLGSFAAISSGPNARRASVFAGTSADQVESAAQQRATDSVQWFAEPNPSRVSVVYIKIGFKKFPGFGHSGRDNRKQNNDPSSYRGSGVVQHGSSSPCRYPATGHDRFAMPVDLKLTTNPID